MAPDKGDVATMKQHLRPMLNTKVAVVVQSTETRSIRSTPARTFGCVFFEGSMLTLVSGVQIPIWTSHSHCQVKVFLRCRSPGSLVLTHTHLVYKHRTFAISRVPVFDNFVLESFRTESTRALVRWPKISSGYQLPSLWWAASSWRRAWNPPAFDFDP